MKSLHSDSKHFSSKLVMLRQRLLEISNRLTIDRYEGAVEFYVNMLPVSRGVERCTVFILDRQGENVCSIFGTGLGGQHIVAPVKDSIAGRVIEQGNSIIENSLAGMKGFHLESDEKTGFSSRNVLCVPIRSIVSDHIIGAIQLLNKADNQSFDELDLEALEKISEGLSSSLEPLLLNKEIVAMAASVEKEMDSLHSARELLPQFIAESKVMEKTLELVMLVAKTPVNVLISGENGTGKELLARMIHGKIKEGVSPFVAVNCASIPENLAESEFFGHSQGAFTGADHSRKGRFEEAHGGSLFLDEIGEMDYGLQAKFLRALEQGEGARLGSNEVIGYDFRLISATNKKLADEVKKGNFREDLYFRLFSIEIAIPPLRDRQDDILPLAMSFLKRTNKQFDKKVAGFSSEVLQIYEKYSWPGNVRQLLKEVERGVVLTEDGAMIGAEACSAELLTGLTRKGSSKTGGQ
ncbi:MAG: sigma-54-dependent Fis family transcriptional regulator, partial [Thermodesulfobacteriota bacterium]